MDVGTLVAFLVIDLLLVLTPGADWAYAITAGLRDRSVLPAVAGLVAGYAGHTLLVVAGVAVLVATTPSLLTVLTALGAVYLIWLGGNVVVRPVGPSADPTTSAPSALRVMLRGAGISGLNPKGMLLYLALLPQFVQLDAGWPVAAQIGLLGGLHMVNCATIYLAVGALARILLQGRPQAARAVIRIAGVMMIAVGGLLLLEHIAP